jgi:hypothetical protein
VFETVVVGADDSSTARMAVIAYADVAKLAGGKLHIATSYDPKAVRVEVLPEEVRYASRVNPADALSAARSTIAVKRGLEPVVHAATGSPGEAIEPVAE